MHVATIEQLQSLKNITYLQQLQQDAFDQVNHAGGNSSILPHTELGANKCRFYALLASKLEAAQMRIQMVALKRIQADGTESDSIRSLTSQMKCLKKLKHQTQYLRQVKVSAESANNRNALNSEKVSVGSRQMLSLPKQNDKDGLFLLDVEK